MRINCYNSNIENLVAQVVKRNETKRKQLEKVAEISCHLTSDAGLIIEAEMYKNNIVRFLIRGTRSGMTITYNALTWEIVRKPRGEKPWFTQKEFGHNAFDILDKADC